MYTDKLGFIRAMNTFCHGIIIIRRDNTCVTNTSIRENPRCESDIREFPSRAAGEVHTP